MADPMRIRAALAGEETTVRVLMAHVMEPGTRKDASGALIPGHFIQDVEATHNGKAVLKAKVWKRGEKEPEKWTIEAVDEEPNLAGSPGLFGNANDSEITIDNILVTKNK